MKRYLLPLVLLSLHLTVFAQSNKKSVAYSYLNNNKEKLGLTVSDINDALISDMYQSKHNGVTHIYFNQAYKGIPVNNAIFTINVKKDDEVLFHHNGFIQDLQGKINTSKSQFNAVDALEATALAMNLSHSGHFKLLKSNDKGELVFDRTDFSDDVIRVKPIYFQVSEDDVRLSWEVAFSQKNSSDSWSSKIDAVTAQVLEMENRTIYCNHTDAKHHYHSMDCYTEKVEVSSIPPAESSMMGASYRVYPVPLTAPNEGVQELVVDPHYPEASPFGWHDIDGAEGPEFTITRGNNVHAYNDANNDNSSSGDEPDGGIDLLFDIVHDTNTSPEDNADADVVNLFYANNMIHDITYLAGFDEQAGNFQANNYGAGGLDSDFVVAHALDGSGEDNANFSLAPDGVNGNMNMFKWNIPQSRLFSIGSPAELEKNYENGGAGDGWGFDETYQSYDFEAELAPAYDDDAQYSNNVCGPVTNPEEIEGKIAMIYRGRCEFGTKSLNAQNAGAIAVIICNVPGAGNDPSSDGNDPISNGMGPGADGAAVTIPVFALGFEDCNRIVATIEAGTPVVGRVKPEDITGPPQVSSGFDNGIIFHEFGHGISSRLTGGPSQICLSNDEQMGEGWSDFFTLALTVKPGEDGAVPRAVGTFVQGEEANGRGIRRFPYSTDMSVNPQTFKDIKATTAPHPLGEVWVDMLWDIYWAYVDKYGYDPDWTNTESGNFQAVQLVLDGMKMQGCRPGFIRGRDAILAAEEANTAGENKCIIWDAFARRGLGFFADGGDENNRNDGSENFDPLPECQKTLKIYKEIPGLIEREAEILVQLIVANHKDSTVTDVLVSDQLPRGMSYVMSSASHEASVNGDQIFFEFDSLQSQQWDTITFRLQHDNSFNSVVLNNNTVDSNEDIAEWQRELIEGEINIFRINSNTFFPTYSGENCWFVQEIDDDSEASIRFNDIEVVGEKPVIRFWHRINTEFTRNGGFVEYSTDGVLWEDAKDLFIRNGYECPLAFTTFAIPALQAFSGRTGENDYVDSYIDLSDFIGQTISLRFRFGTNSGTGATANDEVFPADGGWFIDDIDLIDLVLDKTTACISTSDDEACTLENVSVLDPQIITSTEDLTIIGERLSIYPNPAGDFINIDITSKQNQDAILDIVDVRGQLIYSESLVLNNNRNTHTINTSQFNTGIYFVQLRTSTQSFTQKLILE